MSPTVLQGNAAAPSPPIPPLPGRPGGSTGGAAPEAPAVGIEGQGTTGGAPGTPANRTTSTEVPSIPFDPNLALQQATPIIGMSLAMVVVIFIGFPLTLAYTRRLARRATAGTVQAGDLQPQLRQLQESVDAMAIELERISEAQRFQAKLMAERGMSLPEGRSPG